MKKYLITGGAGFIGSHLTDKLLKGGNQVVVVDDLSEGKKDNLPNNPNLQFYQKSILDEIGNLFEGVHTVFHLAALTRPQESIINSEETNLVNVQGTVRVLNFCKENKIKRVVFASTTGLYGTQKKLPTSEVAIPDPMSPYALTKLIGEQYCKLYERMYGLEINCIRPFNVYGPRQNPKGNYAAAVPKFIDALNKNETPWITGDGTQSRDFIYVDDVVELMILMSKSKVFGESFNAGSGESTSINNLYRTISKIMSKDIKPNYIAPVFEPPITLGDITKAQTILGWKPKISLDEGLKRIIYGK